MVFRSTVLLAASALAIAPSVLAVTNYADDFVNPTDILEFKYKATTAQAQQTIISWANSLAAEGPWTVTKKNFTAPSGDVHDYMSWAPYFWPDCTGVGNATTLSVDQMFKQCKYVNEDGNLNPDARLINNVGDFDDMANAVLFNALAWAITRSPVYSQRVVTFIDAWFLNADTKMNPNLNYAQMGGGPDGQVGTHTGLLDFKCMAKIASGVEIMRNGNAEGWNSTFDQSLQDWVKEYTQWAITAPMALEEKAALNNHGSFYYVQIAALYTIVKDKENVVKTTQDYFSSIYQGQISANGDQPLESARTRPYHYLAYNLAAMVTIARLSAYAGTGFWDTPTSVGGTIKKAADYAMTFDPKNEKVDELYPYIAAVATVFGDEQGTYAAWLNKQTNGAYIADASFFWNQPLSDSGLSANVAGITYAGADGQVATAPVTAIPTGGTAAAGANDPVSTTGGAGSSASGKDSGASAVVPSAAFAIVAGAVALYNL